MKRSPYTQANLDTVLKQDRAAQLRLIEGFFGEYGEWYMLSDKNIEQLITVLFDYSAATGKCHYPEN